MDMNNRMTVNRRMRMRINSRLSLLGLYDMKLGDKEIEQIKENTKKAPASLCLLPCLLPVIGTYHLRALGKALLKTTSISTFTVMFRDPIYKVKQETSKSNVPTEGNVPVDLDSWKDILHFVETNKHLQVLQLCHNTTPQECVTMLQVAAAKNDRIKKVCFVGYRHKGPKSKRKEIQQRKKVQAIPSKVKDVRLHNIDLTSNELVEFIPLDHSIQRLDLNISAFDMPISTHYYCGSGNNDEGYKLSYLWERLEECSTKIQHIAIKIWPKGYHQPKWIPSLPLYLRSNKSAIQRLDLNQIKMYDYNNPQLSPPLLFKSSDITSNRNRSPMDALIYGLAGSPTTTTLSFRACGFDDSTWAMLQEAVLSGLLPVKHLEIYSPTHRDSGNRDEDHGRLDSLDVSNFLRGCNTLESLALVMHTSVPNNRFTSDKTDFHDMEEAIRTTSLSTLCFNPRKLRHFGPALKTALATGNLVNLSLQPHDEDYVMDELDLDCLIELVKEETNLEDLSLLNWGCTPAAAHKIVDLFVWVGKSSLQKFLFHANNRKLLPHVTKALCENLGSFQTLKSLQVGLQLTNTGVHVLSASIEEAILAALTTNWMLESFMIIDTTDHDESKLGDTTYDGTSIFDRSNDFGKYRQPGTSAYFRKKAEGVCLRNKAKKDISAITEDSDVTMDELMGKLKSYKELPDELAADELSLTFLLLERLPGKFF